MTFNLFIWTSFIFCLTNLKIITMMNWMLIPPSGEQDMTDFLYLVFLGF
jgi:hypothetical protein